MKTKKTKNREMCCSLSAGNENLPKQTRSQQKEEKKQKEKKSNIDLFLYLAKAKPNESYYQCFDSLCFHSWVLPERRQFFSRDDGFILHNICG